MMKYFRAIPDWGRWLIAFVLFLVAIGIFGVFAFAPTHCLNTASDRESRWNAPIGQFSHRR